MTLAELKVGDRAVIEEIFCKAETKRRMMDIGLRKGAMIQIKRFAPMGDPVELAILDFSLALRLDDAKNIQVRRIAESTATPNAEQNLYKKRWRGGQK